MSKLPKKVMDLQQSCRSAVSLIGKNSMRYKEILRRVVPLPVDSFVYEFETFSQISHYLNIPERDMFTYEDWAEFLSDILMESELVHMRSYSDRARLESLVSAVRDLRQVGEAHPRFQRIWRRREEMMNEFLISPYLLNVVMSKGVLDEDGLKSAWDSRLVDGDVVFLEPIIKCCVQKIHADKKIIPSVKQALSFCGVMKDWKSLLLEDKFVELYEFVFNKVEKLSKN